jgi:hypothetical protein
MLECHDSTTHRHPAPNHFKPNTTIKFSLAFVLQNGHPTDKYCLSLLGAPCPLATRKETKEPAHLPQLL